jgi:hypothetical protein
MKLATSAAIIVFLTLPALAQRATITIPETGKSIVLSFEPAPQTNNDFQSIHVKAEGKSFTFVTRNPIARIPDTPGERLQRGLWDKVSGLQLDPSRFFFRGEYTADSKPHTLLFFVSQPGIEAAPLFVLGFSDDGTPYKVLERNALDLSHFKGDDQGNAVIIGKATMSQVMYGDGSNGSKTPYATTYDPFSVFIVHASSFAEYSLTESQSYNQQHHVWAGPESREDYAVIYNLPGHSKPFGAPASHIDTLLRATRSTTK